MKSLNLILTTTSLVFRLTLAAQQCYADKTCCDINHHDIYNAINEFCNTDKDDIVVPSKYAADGKTHGEKWVGIREYITLIKGTIC